MTLLDFRGNMIKSNIAFTCLSSLSCDDFTWKPAIILYGSQGATWTGNMQVFCPWSQLMFKLTASTTREVTVSLWTVPACRLQAVWADARWSSHDPAGSSSNPRFVMLVCMFLFFTFGQSFIVFFHYYLFLFYPLPPPPIPLPPAITTLLIVIWIYWLWFCFEPLGVGYAAMRDWNTSYH